MRFGRFLLLRFKITLQGDLVSPSCQTHSETYEELLTTAGVVWMGPPATEATVVAPAEVSLDAAVASVIAELDRMFHFKEGKRTVNKF